MARFFGTASAEPQFYMGNWIPAFVVGRLASLI